MSEHHISLTHDPQHPKKSERAVSDLLDKVSSLKSSRPSVYADVVHPGIAASIVDPDEKKTEEKNRALKADFESA